MIILLFYFTEMNRILLSNIKARREGKKCKYKNKILKWKGILIINQNIVLWSTGIPKIISNGCLPVFHFIFGQALIILSFYSSRVITYPSAYRIIVQAVKDIAGRRPLEELIAKEKMKRTRHAIPLNDWFLHNKDILKVRREPKIKIQIREV